MQRERQHERPPGGGGQPRLGGAAALLHRVFERFVGTGTLTVQFASGRTETYGDGTPPAVGIAFTSPEAERGMLTNPGLKLGEGYVDGTIELREGDLYDLLHIMVGNRSQGRLPAPMRALAKAGALARPQRLIDARRARANAAHHYDLDNRLYELFLDEERQYSCAYFARPDMSLEEAQRAKVERIARKLAPEPGQRALDIGSGWGGMALHLAREHGMDVTGVTLSQEQLGVSRERAAAAGLEERVRFELMDYRDVEGPFDRIVSIGMLEHVGRRALDAYFAKVFDLLGENGVALIHSISRYNPPRPTNPWLEKYIFPGGYIPAPSEALAAVERSGLLIADMEVWRLHYAETLRHWRRRFLANRDKARALHDERFCRMWDYYLASSEASFRVGGNMVIQLLLLKDRTALPQTRSYMEAG